jgi:two-component system, chemotaxis family, chemotaxis protein CheY
MTTGLQGKSILVVDDSPATRDRLIEIYEGIGLKIAGIAENGVEAIRQYRETRPDVVSLDIVMPEMNGVECLRNLLEINPQLRFVVVSVMFADTTISDRLREVVPPSHCIGKPLDQSQIAATLISQFADGAGKQAGLKAS